MRRRPFEPPESAVHAFLAEMEREAGGAARSAPTGVSSGALGYASGGPTWLDAYRSKRPPSPTELINSYKAVTYACVRLNSLGVSRAPLRLYARTKAGGRKPRRAYRDVPDRRQRHLRGLLGRDDRTYSWGRQDLARSIGVNDEVHEVTDHPLLDALDRPNPFFDRASLLSYLVACLDVVGQAFVAPTRADGDPTWAASELWPLQPQYVFPVRGLGSEVLRAWRYFGDEFTPDELLRMRWVSLRDPYLSGYSPLHACYEQAGLIDYYTASVEGILKGGAMPAGIVSPSDPTMPMGEDEAQRLDKDLNNRQTGPNKGRWWVQRTPLNVHPLTFSPVDLGGLQLSKEQRLLAANCFDVPISLLQSEDSNKATAQESSYQHAYYALAPRCCLIDTALTQQLAKPVDDRLFFAFDDPVQRDVQRDAAIFDMALKNGSRTINEGRAEDGLMPVPWGDEPWTPGAAAHAEPDADDAAKATAPTPAPTQDQGQGQPATADVQGQALNGAQVASMLEIVTGVRDGTILAESAKPLLKAAFPAIDAATIDAMIDPIEVKAATPDPTPPRPAPQAPPPPAEPDGDEAEAEAEPDREETAEAAQEQRSLYARMHQAVDLITARFRPEPEPEPGPEPGPEPERVGS